MLNGLASGLAITLVLGAIAALGWLVGGGPIRDRSGTAILLRYSPKFRGVGLLVGVLAPMAIAIAVPVGIQMGYNSPGRTIGLLCLSGFFLAIGLPLAVEGFRRQVMLDDSGITSRSWFGTLRHIPWKHVERVDNRTDKSCFQVDGARQTIRISHYMGGLELFAQECKQRLKSEQYASAFDKPVVTLLG